jgi:hypothetical protein
MAVTRTLARARASQRKTWSRSARAGDSRPVCDPAVIRAALAKITPTEVPTFEGNPGLEY